jgi:ABC-type Fe2+-enterobactin transport system substrate-binding protein
MPVSARRRVATVFVGVVALAAVASFMVVLDLLRLSTATSDSGVVPSTTLSATALPIAIAYTLPTLLLLLLLLLMRLFRRIMMLIAIRMQLLMFIVNTNSSSRKDQRSRLNHSLNHQKPYRTLSCTCVHPKRPRRHFKVKWTSLFGGMLSLQIITRTRGKC